MGQTRRSGPTVLQDRPTNHHRDSTVPQGSDDWRERVREQVRATSRRREIRKQIREQFAVARAAGLRRRHATKLGRCRHG